MQRGYSDNYLEDEVLSASPVELVGLLYQGALEAMGEVMSWSPSERYRLPSRA